MGQGVRVFFSRDECQKLVDSGVYDGDLLFFGRHRGVQLCSGVFFRTGGVVWTGVGLVFFDPAVQRRSVFVVPWARGQVPYVSDLEACVEGFLSRPWRGSVALGHRKAALVYQFRPAGRAPAVSMHRPTLFAQGVEMGTGNEGVTGSVLLERAVYAKKYRHHALVSALFFLGTCPDEWRRVAETGEGPARPSGYAKRLGVFAKRAFFPRRWDRLRMYRAGWPRDAVAGNETGTGAEAADGFLPWPRCEAAEVAGPVLCAPQLPTAGGGDGRASASAYPLPPEVRARTPSALYRLAATRGIDEAPADATTGDDATTMGERALLPPPPPPPPPPLPVEDSADPFCI
jgi:hypothetical protein